MEPVRPLRDVFAGLADTSAAPEDAGASPPDPRSLLGDYHDLPDDLLVTAIGSYANTAPAEVAEHLSGFVAEPGADPADGLDLLASAPIVDWEHEVDLPDSPDDGSGVLLQDGRPLMDDDITDEAGRDIDPGLSIDHVGHADALDHQEPADHLDDAFGFGEGEGEDAGAGEATDPSAIVAESGSDLSLDEPDDGTSAPDGTDRHDYLDDQIGDHELSDPTALDGMDGMDQVDETDGSSDPDGMDDFDA